MKDIDRLIENAEHAIGRQPFTSVLHYILQILKCISEHIDKLEKGGN